MKAKPKLIIYSTDSVFLEKLKPFSAELPYVGYAAGNGPQVTASASLDALWATLMAGVELFGAAPPFPLHEALVFKTPASQMQRGMPRHGIVGVAISKDDPKTPDFSLRLVLSALLKAVEDFNFRNTDQIARIGILPDDLELRRLEAPTAFNIIREVYERQGLTDQ